MKRTQDVCYHYPHCTATKIQPVQCTWEKICFWVSNWFVLGLSPVWVPVTVSGCCEQMLTPSFILFVGPVEFWGGKGWGAEGSIALLRPLWARILKELEATHVSQDNFLILLDPQILRPSDVSVCYLVRSFVWYFALFSDSLSLSLTTKWYKREL